MVPGERRQHPHCSQTGRWRTQLRAARVRALTFPPPVRHSATKGILVAMVCTFFEAFNVPVFWPILVMYFIMLFCITMKRQIKVPPGALSPERRCRLQRPRRVGRAGATWNLPRLQEALQTWWGDAGSLPSASGSGPRPVSGTGLGRKGPGLCPPPGHGILWVRAGTGWTVQGLCTLCPKTGLGRPTAHLTDVGCLPARPACSRDPPHPHSPAPVAPQQVTPGMEAYR